jgi:hypothetical protein
VNATVAALAVVAAGLLGRAAIDKALALEGGAEAVATWAQLTSVFEVVCGPALAGVGTGVTVLAARHVQPGERRVLLAGALRLGLAMSTAMLAAVLLAALTVPEAMAASYPAWLLALAAGAGWIATAGGISHGYWIGTRESGRMLAFAVASAALPAAIAFVADGGTARGLAAITLAQAIPALVLAAALPWKTGRTDDFRARRMLARYLLPGISIGILSPASLFAARAIMASQISWESAGVVQALWRASDWIAMIASGVLSIRFLPALSSASGPAQFDAQLRRAVKVVLLPACVASLMLYAFRHEVLATLYDARFRLPDGAAATLLAGSALRVAAWVPLFALYAQGRTRAIALGEFLSLPLFVALLALWPGRLDVEAVGWAWLAAYAVYAAFNVALVVGPLRSRG